MASKSDVYTIVTDQVIKALEAGTIPWHQPWSAELGMPKSMSTKRPYRGVNVFLLGLTSMVNGYKSSWYGTYKKIAELGGQVRKGEHGTLVTFWTSFKKEVTDPDTGEKAEERRFVLRYYKVFNVEQADWPEDSKRPAEPKLSDIDTIAEAEKIVTGYPKPPVINQDGTAAYYRPVVDTVTVPPRGSFETSESFYSTLFHELIHSTGHDDRLSRESVRTGSFGRFGDHAYSKEELVAEMGSTMLAGIAGINSERTLPNSAAYVASWLKVLKGDSKLVVQAAAQAQHAADFILGTKFDNDEESGD